MQSLVNLTQGSEEKLFERVFTYMKSHGAKEAQLKKFESNYPNELETQLDYTKAFLLQNNFAF